MSEISSSIWNQDKNGDWKLYFNTDAELSSHKTHKEEQKQKDKLNLFTKNLMLGTLVMTPKGIGRIIKNIDEIVYIHFDQDNKEYQFPSNEILNYFNCYITFMSKGNIDIVRLKLKVDGKVSDIFDELNKLKKINSEEKNYVLIYNKSQLAKENTFEQLNICNKAKILILEMNETEKKINRFLKSKKFWCNYDNDGICFSPSENIKLSGVGIYSPHDNKVINGVIKIIEGPSIAGKILLEQNAELQPCFDNINIISKIEFSKKIICKKNMDYSILFSTNVTSNCYSGNLGKKIIEGEKGIFFTFKTIIGNTGGSLVEFGNFPEIYYY